jgi:hypothetical protein
MKTLKIFLIILMVGMIIKNEKIYAQNTHVSFQIFYDNLSSYGSWIVYPDHGYVWVPDAGPEFFPYSTSGYWAYTEFGWTWVSDYSWGWAPFHYGRWVYDSFYGWLWVPGEEWGPAWVVWRRSPGYYGWAPLAPGISVTVAIGGSYQPDYNNWVFVDEHYIGRRDQNKYYGPRKNNAELVNNSRIINTTKEDKHRRTTYIAGPEKNEIQKITCTEINLTPVKESARPEQKIENNQINLYRPAITRTTEDKPAKIKDRNEITPVSERKNPDLDRKENVPLKQNKVIPRKEDVPKNDGPRPVVPDNTRTKKEVPKKSIDNNNVSKEAPIPVKANENRTPKPIRNNEPVHQNPDLKKEQKQSPPNPQRPVEKRTSPPQRKGPR